ncbi:hypothetical protein E1301_Tti016993 [Triplophysa tibetana]|uniref:Fibronectin type-III domain-containing protein n=1 Tax=Triplophysa tibetana TaxID=1572043 RepID=A0A5A9N7Z4_9TELE|nr:hypothetical protein E1301_Tti016993 [Triplophysa tibetana]
MVRTGILWIFWTLSLQSRDYSHASTNQHNCDTDYWLTITCSIPLPVTSSGNKNISYWLKLDDEQQTFTCPLHTENEVHRCVLDREYTFMDDEYLTVTLYRSENSQNDSYLSDSVFYPAKSIKPNAPYNLTLQYTNGSYHFSWEDGYEKHLYQEALLFNYNFLYYTDGDHGNTSVYTDDKTIGIDETFFDPESAYTAMAWVLAKSPLQDVHAPEVYSTIDKITEVITIYKDQAEKSNMYPLAQSHTPYVGPSTELWAPCQNFDTCSGTMISCEDFSLSCEALPDKANNLMQSLTTACFTDDELSSKASSLKSLESLGNDGTSEAPVISFPTSLCFKQDYCTLTDTPTGPVPTFTGDVELNGDMHND